ncbi:MAG: D-alanyl-D-alanine carboxypeptidase [bacterium]|nr:D-alanyl-D-alanine carboxypeptidase [bacterium]
MSRRLFASVLALWLAVPSLAHAEPPLQAAARDLVGADQGVYVVTASGEVLASQMAERAVHPASVSKVPTTLALLARLGPTHRFTTRVFAGGPVVDGRLRGDLIIEGGHDAFFVSENAFLVLARLDALGVRNVDGDLVVRGPLIFNWKPDDGRRIRDALTGKDSEVAWHAVVANGSARGSLAEARLAFAATAPTGETEPTLLLAHRSEPLVPLVKALNGYSNNVFHYLSDAIGGPPAVEAIAKAAVPAEMRDEIVLDNGAGAGTTNRLSPRAAALIVQALEAETRRHGLELTAVLPVSGVDEGTLRARLKDHPATVVGKTGTFGGVGACALVGVVRTRRWGEVTFAILNHFVPVPDARARQDAFVRALIAAGNAEPWPYRRADDGPAFTRVVLE